ncbi:MAG: cytochrome b/b6 domain-containing protein [Pseudomonadota bacterium]
MNDAATTRGGERYVLAQRLLHWLIAVLVLGALAGGAILWAYGFQGLRDSFGAGVTDAIYKYHKTTGVLVLGLMLVRLALRLVFGAPQPPRTLSPAVAAMARATHLAFYGLLIVMPVLGWAATAAGGFPVQFFDMVLPGIIGKNEPLSETLFWLHGIVGVAIAALALLHIAAALRHWRVLKDGVMARIALP